MSNTRECDAGELTFKQWMKKVDELLESSKIGLSSSCLADFQYWDFWDLGAEPCEAAQEALWNEYGNRAPVLKEYSELHEE